MSSIDVLGPSEDQSALCVVGCFDPADATVFEQAPPPGPGYLLTRSEKQEVHQALLQTTARQWILRLDFGTQGVEHRYVDDDVADAWLHRNGYLGSCARQALTRITRFGLPPNTI